MKYSELNAFVSLPIIIFIQTMFQWDSTTIPRTVKIICPLKRYWSAESQHYFLDQQLGS